MYGIFKKLLDDNGVRASDVARATGIPPSTFSDWKKGKSEPKKDKIQKICSYFNEPITLFYGESDDNLMGTNVVKEGCGSRRWYLKKGQFDVTYNRYGNYNSPSPSKLNTTFKAIRDFENKDKDAMKIVDEYVKSEDLCFKSQSDYVTCLRLIAQALIIEKKNTAEL